MLLKSTKNLTMIKKLHKSQYKFDINREDLYLIGVPEGPTKKRLTEVAKMGMEELGVAQFGYKGVMSGLHIENIWRFTNKQFQEYMDWAKGLIEKHKANKNEQ